MAFSFVSFFATLYFFIFAVQAFPATLVPKDKLEVYVPKIIKPDAETVWIVGQLVLVTWDISNAPSSDSVSNRALITLRDYGVLAKDFSLLDGNVTVTVPPVNPGKDHVLTLFGDSGNVSPPFTITASS